MIFWWGPESLHEVQESTVLGVPVSQVERKLMGFDSTVIGCGGSTCLGGGGVSSWFWNDQTARAHPVLSLN